MFRRPETPITNKTRKLLFKYKRDVYWHQQYETLYIHLHANCDTETAYHETKVYKGNKVVASL